MEQVMVTGAALSNSCRHPLGPHNLITASININSSLSDKCPALTELDTQLVMFLDPSNLLVFTFHPFTAVCFAFYMWSKLVALPFTPDMPLH